MTCKHCCGADQFFDSKNAEKELKKYKKKGPKGATKRLISVLNTCDMKQSSLLDIGGGVGAIQWYALSNGSAKTTDVDASGGYLLTAERYASENGWEDKSHFIQGDFTDVAHQVEMHDFVTLDKVICCYPDYRRLLENASAKTSRVMVLSFPIGGIISRSLSKLAALYFKWKKSPFRTYVHDPRDVHQFIESRGLKRTEKIISFPWNVWAYERTN